MKTLIWYVFAGTRGGEMRIKIVNLLLERPRNANQLCLSLNVDYKTIQHHLRVLYKNKMVIVEDKKMYGATYLVSSLLEDNINIFKEIWERFGKK